MPRLTECPECGHSLKLIKFANETKRKQTCPDCGWRKDLPPKYAPGSAKGTILANRLRREIAATTPDPVLADELAGAMEDILDGMDY